MKSIIIGDIHNDTISAQKICDKHTDANEIVFLGDYFDDFDDCAYNLKQTADWLLESLSHKNRIHMLGNHDVHYFCPNKQIIGSGFTNGKLKEFNNHPISKTLFNFKLSYYTQDYLCSHAGIYPSLIPITVKDIPVWLQFEEQKILENMKRNIISPLLKVGFSRYGSEMFGGITWLDWNEEFEPIEGLNQIVGHTRNKEVRRNFNNYCIDTKPGKGTIKQYLMIENKEVKILDLD